jgi:anthranilate phosphoribosyltransferase
VSVQHTVDQAAPQTGVSGDPELITRSIDALASGVDLTADQTAAVLAQIMAGDASQIQIAGFLIALRTKGETCSTRPAPVVADARSMSRRRQR